MVQRMCPFCGNIVNISKYINAICPNCNSKYYIMNKYWLNRKTGEKRGYKND